VKKSRDIIFEGKSGVSGTAKPIRPSLWAWKLASKESRPVLSPTAVLPMNSLKPEMKNS